MFMGGILGPLTYWGATHLTSLKIINATGFFAISIIFWSVLFASIHGSKKLQKIFFNNSAKIKEM